MKRQTQKENLRINKLEVLEQTLQLNQLILDNSHDLITIHRLADLSYEYVNPAVIKVLGYSQEELFAQSPLELIHPDDIGRITGKLKKGLPTGGEHEELRCRKKDGSYAWLELSITILTREKGDTSMIIISRDVSELKQAENALQHQADTFVDFTEFKRIDRALKIISAITRAIIHTINEEDLLKKVCEKIVDVGGYSLAWVGYLRPEYKQKVQPMAYAGINNAYLAKLNIYMQDPKRGQGPTAIAIRHGIPVVTKDFKKDDTFKPWLKDALRRGFKSSMDIPLMANNEAFGVLSIYAGELNGFDNEEQKLLLDITNNLAYAINSLHARLEGNQNAQELEKSLEKMHRILMQAVTSLGTALNIKDPYTAGHQKQVVRLAIAIAEEMGLSKEQIEGLSVAGNLHDIGKIYVPSEILSKPGKLSDLEFAMIKTHCQAGYEIIKEIEFPWPVAEVLLQHHERIDGSGYPRGIVGDKLLLEARIMAVADVVEAMASHRPYRPALGINSALEEISNNRGILYDPEVVDACLRVFWGGFRLK